MRTYVLRRTLLAVPTLLLSSLLIFSIMRVLPGDIIYTVLGDTLVNVPQSEIEALKKEVGLDKPLHEQYVIWIVAAMKGDLGKSLRYRQPVSEMIASRLPVTLELGVLALLLSVIVGIPVGVLAALRQDTLADYVFRGFAIANLSVPNFWVATLVVVLPAIWFRYTPPLAYISFFDNPIENLKLLFAPAIILGLATSATKVRMTRAMMLEVMRNDYIRTAWAKGLPERLVIYRHALKNALIPVVTLFGLQVTAVLGGTVIMESVFSLPGMGRLLIEAITYRDYTVVQGIAFLIVVWVVITNLLVDLSYGFLDPRIRFG